MKHSNKLIFITLLAIIGSYLFYEETTGINTFVFSLLSCGLAYKLSPVLTFRNKWLEVLPPLVTSMVLIIYPQQLTYTIWVVSYLTMWSAIALRLQPLLLPIQSALAVLQSVFKLKALFIDLLGSCGKEKKGKAVVYSVSIIIITVFVLLYANGNPVVGDMLSRIDLSFVEFGFILTAFLFFIMLTGLALMKGNPLLEKINDRPVGLLFTEISKKDENEFRIAKLSIWSIAILLCGVNLLDLVVILTGKLPVGITYSEYVHQGFYTLIFTLTLAVCLVIYFFRNQLNFYKHIDKLRRASYFWIAQNIALAVLTCYKNMLYVEVYGLTYKRIAVFLYLLCTLIGLVLSLKKVKHPATNWFYFNQVSYYAFICAILISLVPFDKVITHYNLNFSHTIDLDYLLDLKHADYYEIVDYAKREYQIKEKYLMEIDNNIKKLNQEHGENHWQSWNYYTYKNRLLTPQFFIEKYGDDFTIRSYEE